MFLDEATFLVILAQFRDSYLVRRVAYHALGAGQADLWPSEGPPSPSRSLQFVSNKYKF